MGGLAEAVDQLSTGGVPAYRDETSLSEGYAVTQGGRMIPRSELEDEDVGINQQVARDMAESGEQMDWQSGVFIDSTLAELDVGDGGSGASTSVVGSDSSGDGPSTTSDGGNGSGSGQTTGPSTGGGLGGMDGDNDVVLAVAAIAAIGAAAYAWRSS